MRTKLIFGLTAGIMAAACVGNAQTVSTSGAADTIFNNFISGYAETLSAPVQNSLTVDAAPAADISREPISTAPSAFSHFQNLSDSISPDLSLALPDSDAPQASTFVDAKASASSPLTLARQLRNNSAGTEFGLASGANWTDLALGDNTFGATSGSRGESAFLASSGTFSESITPSSREEVDQPFRAASKAEGVGAVPLPQVASPEPGTLGLLLVGSSALASRLMLRRRK